MLTSSRRGQLRLAEYAPLSFRGPRTLPSLAFAAALTRSRFLLNTFLPHTWHCLFLRTALVPFCRAGYCFQVFWKDSLANVLFKCK